MLATSAGEDSLTPAASPRLNVTTHSKAISNSNHLGFTASFRRNDSCSRQNSSGGGGGTKHKNSRMSPLAISASTNNMPSLEGAYQETSMRSGESSSPASPAPISVGAPKGQINNHLYRQSSTYGNTSVGLQTTNTNTAGILRRCNQAKSLKRKKRVIQMLGVVVAEFFVCWAPLYVMVISFQEYLRLMRLYCFCCKEIAEPCKYDPYWSLLKNKNLNKNLKFKKK